MISTFERKDLFLQKDISVRYSRDLLRLLNLSTQVNNKSAADMFIVVVIP